MPTEPPNSEAPQAVDDLPRLAPRLIPADLRHISRVTIYEVFEHELNQLDQVVAEENQALGFATTFLGLLVGAATSALTDWPKSPTRALAFEIICGLLVVGSVWFGMTWNRKRKSRTTLLEKIRKERGRAQGTA